MAVIELRELTVTEKRKKAHISDFYFTVKSFKFIIKLQEYRLRLLNYIIKPLKFLYSKLLVPNKKRK